MDNQTNIPNEAPVATPKRKMSRAEIFAYVAVAIPALYFVLAIIETIFSFVLAIPIIGYAAYPLYFLTGPFIDLGQFLTIWGSPIMAVVALVTTLSHKKSVLAQEAPDATESEIAKRNVLLSILALVVSVLIWIIETVKAIISIILTIIAIAAIIFISLAPGLISTLLPYIINNFM